MQSCKKEILTQIQFLTLKGKKSVCIIMHVRLLHVLNNKKLKIKDYHT